MNPKLNNGKGFMIYHEGVRNRDIQIRFDTQKQHLFLNSRARKI